MSFQSSAPNQAQGHMPKACDNSKTTIILSILVQTRFQTSLLPSSE